MRLDGVEDVRYLYHDAGHAPMKTYAPLRVVNRLIGARVLLNDRCCGESDSLATSRPDVSTQVRFRKRPRCVRARRQRAPDGFSGDVKVLTSCPSWDRALV